MMEKRDRRPITIDLSNTLADRLDKFMRKQKPPFVPTKRGIIEAALSEYLDKMEHKS